MRHLKAADPQHTVIMVQVENEPGAWNAIRDYSPAAQKALHGARPGGAAEGARQGRPRREATGRRSSARTRTSSSTPGRSRASSARWPPRERRSTRCRSTSTPRCATRSPSRRPAPTRAAGRRTTCSTSGRRPPRPWTCWRPTSTWTTAARHLKVLDLYSRPDNALFVPETGRAPAMSRYFYAALARGAIGWSPFGIDSLVEGSARRAPRLRASRRGSRSPPTTG